MENNRDLENLLNSFKKVIQVIEEPVREVTTELGQTKMPTTDEERTLYRYMMSLRARRLSNAVDENGKNADGYYYNPATKEFDPNYNPIEDPRFISRKAATDTVEKISRSEEIARLQENIDAMQEQIEKNPALASNESMRNTLEAEKAKRDGHIEAIDQVIREQERLIARLEHLQNYLEKQIAMFSNEFTEFSNRFFSASREEKQRIKESGEGKSIAENYGRVRELDRQLALIKAATDSARKISDAWGERDLASLEDVITEAYISTRIIGEYQAKKEADIIVRFNDVTKEYDVFLRQYDTLSEEDIKNGVVPQLHSDKMSIPADDFNAESLNKRIAALRNRQKVNELQDKITIITFPDGTVIPAIGANIEMVVDEKIREDSISRRKDRKNKHANPTPEGSKKEEPKKSTPAPTPIPVTPKEEEKESILVGLTMADVLKDNHYEYVLNEANTLAAYFIAGGETNAGSYKNPRTGKFDKSYSPLGDPKYQIFDVYDIVKVVDKEETLARYQAAGYGTNEEGLFFNPASGEYETGYSPFEDVMFRVQKEERRKIGTLTGMELAKNPNLEKVTIVKADELKPEDKVEEAPTKVVEEPTKVFTPVPPVAPVPEKTEEKKEDTPADPTKVAEEPTKVVETPVAPVVEEVPPVVAESVAPAPTLRERSRTARQRVRAILNKLELEVDDKAMDSSSARKLKARSISLSPKGLFNFKEYDYAIQKIPKVIVGLVTYIPVTIVKGIYKVAQDLRTSADDLASWQVYKDNFEALPEEEKQALFDTLKTNRVKMYGITDTQALLLKDVVYQWASKKIQQLNSEISDITKKTIGDAKLYVETVTQLDNPEITPEVRASLESKIGKLAVGKADALAHRQALIEDVEYYINGGVQGFSQTMRDIVSHQSFRGQHFAKGLTYDRELNLAQEQAESKLANAINSTSPTRDADAMLAFIEMEKIVNDATELDGKKQVGAREYEPEVKEMSHREDTFYKDWVMAIALVAQGYAIGRQVADNIKASNMAATDENLAQQYDQVIHQYGQQLEGKAQQMYAGQQVQGMEMAGSNHAYSEVIALDRSNWDINSTTYRGLDQTIHATLEPEQLSAIQQINAINQQYVSGQIPLAEAMRQTAYVTQNQAATLQQVCLDSHQAVLDYATTHPKFDYSAFEASVDVLGQNANYIAQGQFAAADVAQMGAELQNIQIAAQVNSELGSVIADYVPIITSTAALTGVITGLRNKVTQKYQNGEYTQDIMEALDSIDAEALTRAQGRTR